MKFALIYYVFVLLLTLTDAAYSREGKGREFSVKGFKIDLIDEKLGQLNAQNRPITSHDSFPENWLDELQSLDQNSLRIILSDGNHENFVPIYQVEGFKLLNNVKYCLWPKNFFALKGSGINVPLDIQWGLFLSLSMDQICGVLIKDPDSIDKDCGVLTVINKPNIVEALRNLVVKEYGTSLARFLAQVPGLEHLFTWLKHYEFCDYQKLNETIAERVRNEAKYKQGLKKHLFFTEERLSKILNSRDMTRRLTEIVYNEMKKVLSIGYRVLLIYFLQPLHGYLLEEGLTNLLLEESNTWKTFLDHFAQWLVKKESGSLTRIFSHIFSFTLPGFNYNRIPLTWEQAYNDHFEIARKNLPGFKSIETLQQLKMVGFLAIRFEINKIRVRTICYIIKLVSEHQFKHATMFLRENLVTGMEVAMAGLIKTWPALDLFLKTILLCNDYIMPFLDLFWKNNYRCNDLAVVEQFVEYLKQNDKLEIFFKTLELEIEHKMDHKGLEEIGTAEGLLLGLEKMTTAQGVELE